MIESYDDEMFPFHPDDDAENPRHPKSAGIPSVDPHDYDRLGDDMFWRERYRGEVDMEIFEFVPFK